MKQKKAKKLFHIKFYEHYNGIFEAVSTIKKGKGIPAEFKYKCQAKPNTIKEAYCLKKLCDNAFDAVVDYITKEMKTESRYDVDQDKIEIFNPDDVDDEQDDYSPRVVAKDSKEECPVQPDFGAIVFPPKSPIKLKRVDQNDNDVDEQSPNKSISHKDFVGMGETPEGRLVNKPVIENEVYPEYEIPELPPETEKLPSEAKEEILGEEQLNENPQDGSKNVEIKNNQVVLKKEEECQKESDTQKDPKQ